MKITFLVAALDNGGGARVLAQYAFGLIQLGHDVTVVSPAPFPFGNMAKISNRLFGYIGEYPTNHFDRLGVPVIKLERYRPITSNDVPDADLVIATWWETVIWMARLSPQKGKHIHFVQDYEVWGGRQEEVERVLKLPIPKITISKWLQTTLTNFGSLPTPIVPNGVDQELFFAAKRDKPICQTVGFVFAANQRKGADIAIQAIQLAQLELPNLITLVFGHASTENLRSVANLTFYEAPAQNELRHLYSECTLWLFPSREEGFGLPILEAMACGTPVLATPAGAAPEIIKKGGGILLKNYDPHNMADQIINIANLSNRDWKSISINATKVSSLYNWHDSLKIFNIFLNDIVNSN